MEWLAVLTPIALALAGGAGYLLRRWLERQPANEQLDRQLKAVSLKRAMDEAGLDAASLQTFTAEMTGRLDRMRSREDAVLAKLPDDHPLEPMTQLEMNFAASHRAQAAALVLNRVTNEFSGRIEPEDAALLGKAMDAWETLVESHANIAAGVFRGGSMAQMAYWAERERMTLIRIAELQELIAERKELEGED